jgi:hypothetical protein
MFADHCAHEPIPAAVSKSGPLLGRWPRSREWDGEMPPSGIGSRGDSTASASAEGAEPHSTPGGPHPSTVRSVIRELIAHNAGSCKRPNRGWIMYVCINCRRRKYSRRAGRFLLVPRLDRRCLRPKDAWQSGQVRGRCDAPVRIGRGLSLTAGAMGQAYPPRDIGAP